MLLAALLTMGATACGGGESEAEAEPSGPTEIIAIGDSITEGPYFRPFLLRSFADIECDVDFVGSRVGVTTLDGTDAIAGLDVDHQAIGGATSTEIRDALVAVVTDYNPSIAIVYAGTNDIFFDIDRDVTVANLRQIVDDLRSANPSVAVYLAQLMPIGGAETRMIALNDRIAAAAAGLTRPDSPVVAVDMSTGVTAADDLVDGVHPNDEQSADIADRWLSAMQPRLDEVCT